MICVFYEQDLEVVIDGGVKLCFMSLDWFWEVLEMFGNVCMLVLEFLNVELDQWLDYVVNSQGQYCWKQSDLLLWVVCQVVWFVISCYFWVLLKEFVFLNCKLIGVYIFVVVLYFEFNGELLLCKYFYGDEVLVIS